MIKMSCIYSKDKRKIIAKAMLQLLMCFFRSEGKALSVTYLGSGISTGTSKKS